MLRETCNTSGPPGLWPRPAGPSERSQGRASHPPLHSPPQPGGGPPWFARHGQPPLLSGIIINSTSFHFHQFPGSGDIWRDQAHF